MADHCLACNADLPEAPSASGQRRLYCSDACRSRGYRRRKAARALLPTDELQTLVDYAFVKTDPIDAAAELVLTLRAVARRARRCALEAPSQLAWREERTAQAVSALLADLWPVE